MPQSLPDPLMAGRFLQSAGISELEEALSCRDETRRRVRKPAKNVDWFELFDAPETTRPCLTSHR
ncbi:hypothetical protein [Thioclava pacifica]|uniref:Uncharacterized protein n=1 Tax=Thioclava pacifica DSM 10166 TaxID=1353537 RepID=A0A074JGA8_9RHOB|nr:hypothetical protein [Thioclava pacifica]KEO54945.1 hypothetical protein TP2_16995 [Thioclava pacifica DSM 10166]